MNNEVRLVVAADEGVSSALVARVNRACELVEGIGMPLLVRLPGALALTAEPGEPPAGAHVVEDWERALHRLERLPAATVALVEGVCSGPALEVLLTTDLRIAAGDAVLRVTACRTGAWPGMLLYRLATHLGAGAVRRLVLFGGELSTDEAVRLGLLDQAVADPAGAALAAVHYLSTMDGREVAVRRRLLLDAATAGFDEALGAHLAACDRALSRGGAPVPAGRSEPRVAVEPPTRRVPAARAA